MIYKYNDYELLYLIYEKQDEALELMFKKYESLIRTRIRDFHIKSKNYDDFFQEGLIMLKIAIETYDIYERKTFNKYFDLILQRKIREILTRESKYFYHVVIQDNMDYLLSEVKETSFKIEENWKVGLTALEKQVFEMMYESKKDISQIAKEILCDERKIYNAIYRAKKKIRRVITHSNQS
ncbi:MAG TPA: sigma factor-like helix-turn-helix DNA-binding protein [Bacilli bacterium]|jgi:RNA polymerase sporulation-specific sigma factor|nr:sigma factor-like helix-turn-helix DNA-binding protein [Bacilli bacterium]HPL55416.1 sigma factor-like helix-turn-helix DNA-binding protein [Bacilli bacterium]